jgi:hypothetical protein
MSACVARLAGFNVRFGCHSGLSSINADGRISSSELTTSAPSVYLRAQFRLPAIARSEQVSHQALEAGIAEPRIEIRQKLLVFVGPT